MQIQYIVVDETFRRRGFASQLLTHIAEKYISGQRNRITLDVSVNNIPARNFYQKLGFTEVGRRNKYYGSTDAILMERIMDNENKQG